MKNKYVVYVGLKNIEFEDTNRVMDDIRNSFKKIIEEDNKDDYIFCPDFEFRGIKIDCINPKYITEEDLIKIEKDKINKLLNKVKYEQKFEN